jgi:hypothetical protein
LNKALRLDAEVDMITSPPGSTVLQCTYKFVFIALFYLFCSVCVHAAGAYNTAEVEDLRIAIDTTWCDQAAPGYWPIRFDITNLGKDRVIELNGHGNRWSMSPTYIPTEISQFEIRQSIRLKQSDHLNLTIPIPVFTENEELQFTIRERGRIVWTFFSEGLQSNKLPQETSALLIADSATPFGAIASGLLRPLNGGAVIPGAEHAMPILDFILDPSQLPSNWLGLTSIRAVLIGSQEWGKLTGPQKEALLTWTASGGDFIFVDGDLSSLLPDQQTRPVNVTMTEGNQTSYYFGRIQLLSSAELQMFDLGDALRRMSTMGADEYHALPANRSSDWRVFPHYGFCLPIPGIKGSPVRSYLVILIAFSVLIGPANYLWLRRKRRQILIVLTTPLIAAIFILLLSGYAFFGEGLGITGRAESLTLLDQKTNHAATGATVSMYAFGMTPGKGLQFSRDVAVFPLGNGTGKYEQMLLDLTNGQQFAKGILKARVPSNFEQISFRPARERLSFDYKDGGITAVNGLGTTITRLFYRDAGKVYMLDRPLKAGEKAFLHPTDKSILSELPLKYHFLNTIQTERTYIAWLKNSPFIETGASNMTEKDSLHLVLGYVGEK